MLRGSRNAAVLANWHEISPLFVRDVVMTRAIIYNITIALSPFGRLIVYRRFTEMTIDLNQYSNIAKIIQSLIAGINMLQLNKPPPVEGGAPGATIPTNNIREAQFAN